MLFSVLAVIAIVVAASFGLSIAPTAPLYNLPDSVASAAIFVCPTKDPVFDEVARALSMFRPQMTVVFYFFLMLFAASLGWAFYQNLIKDKFEQKAYNNAVFLGKTLFWITLVATILMHAPNAFRAVGVRGADGKFVLCESNTPGARPVRASAVVPRSKIGS